VQHVGLPNVLNRMDLSPLPHLVETGDRSVRREFSFGRFVVDGPGIDTATSNSLCSFQMRSFFSSYLSAMATQVMRLGSSKSANCGVPDVIELLAVDEDIDDRVVAVECVDLTDTKVVIDIHEDAVDITKQLEDVKGRNTNCDGSIINRVALRKLTKWMEIWAGKRKFSKKGRKSVPKVAAREMDVYEEFVFSGISNVLHVLGPSGAGKTAAVYACAAAAGFNVIEVNTSQERKGSEIRKLVSETFQSYGIGVGAVTDQQLNLILFDEADISFDDDINFHSAVAQLAKNFRCPIAVTSENSLSFLRPLDPYTVRFVKCAESELQSFLGSQLYQLSSTSIFHGIRGDRSSNVEGAISEFCLKLVEQMPSVFNHNVRACMQTLYSVESIFRSGTPASACSLAAFVRFSETCVSFYSWLTHRRRYADISLLFDMNKMVSTAPATLQGDLQDCRHSAEHASVKYLFFAPVIFGICPYSFETGQSYRFSIKGKNFLQKDADVCVVIDGVLCDSSVVGDDNIAFILPQCKRTPGLYCVRVDLTCNGRLLVSSELCGVGASSICISDDSFSEDPQSLRKRQYGVLKNLLLASDAPCIHKDVSDWARENGLNASESDDDDFCKTPAKKQINKRLLSKNTRSSQNKLGSASVDITAGAEEASDDTAVLNTASQVPAEEKMKPWLVSREANAEIRSVLLSALFGIVVDARSGPFLQSKECGDYAGSATKKWDLSSVALKLSSGGYDAPQDLLNVSMLVNDVRQIWAHCSRKNLQPAEALSNLFDSCVVDGVTEVVDRLPAGYAVKCDSVQWNGSLVFERYQFEAIGVSSELPVMSASQLIAETTAAAGMRSLQSGRDWSSCWRRDYSACGLEYSWPEQLENSVCVCPTSSNDESAESMIDAFNGYCSLLEGYGDADIMDSSCISPGTAFRDVSMESCSTPLRQIGEGTRMSSLSIISTSWRIHASHSSHAASRSKSLVYLDTIRSLCSTFSGYSKLAAIDDAVYKESKVNYKWQFLESVFTIFKQAAELYGHVLTGEYDARIAQKPLAELSSPPTIVKLVDDNEEEWDGCENVEREVRLPLKSALYDENESETDSISSVDSDDDSDAEIDTINKRTNPIPQLAHSTSGDIYYCRFLQFLKDMSEHKDFVDSIRRENTIFQNYVAGGKHSMIVDVVPLLGRMVQAESILDASKALGLDSLPGGRLGARTRRITRGNTRLRFQMLSASTQLSDDQLNKFLVFGFIGTRSQFEKRVVLPVEPAEWLT
jgi:hypothetical protein